TNVKLVGLKLSVDEENPPRVTLKSASEEKILTYLKCYGLYEDGSESLLTQKNLTYHFDTATWETYGENNTVTVEYEGLSASANFPICRFGDVYKNREEVTLDGKVSVSYYWDGDGGAEEDEYPGVVWFIPPQSGKYEFLHKGMNDDDLLQVLYDYDGRRVKLLKANEERCTAMLEKGETYFLFLYDDEDGYWSVSVRKLAEEVLPVGTIRGATDGHSYRVTKEGKEAAFYKAKAKVKNLVIPDTVQLGDETYQVTSIAEGAMKESTTLQTVVIGSQVTKVGDSAFSDCTKLKAVTLGGGVKKIGRCAFSGCKAMSSLIIPGKVKSIGYRAFYGCKKLKKLTIQSKKLNGQNVGEEAFGNIYKKAKVTVPQGKLTDYKSLLQAKGLPAKAKVKE
ncbi:MAG: leucine-rich repeat domain-containing protein, partial [Blautia sp.]|nr:leucine-rich repeat domain-containing protein [Blautia sp.]